MLASITFTSHCDDKLFFNKLLRGKKSPLPLVVCMIMVVCECAMSCMLELSCSLLCSLQKTTSFCLLISFAIVLYGRRMYLCFSSRWQLLLRREKKSELLRFPIYVFILVPIATKTVMWLFNRNHNSSLNGMRVNSKHRQLHPAPPRRTKPTFRLWVIIVVSFFFWSRSHFNALSHTETLKFKCGISAHTHTRHP